VLCPLTKHYLYETKASEKFLNNIPVACLLFLFPFLLLSLNKVKNMTFPEKILQLQSGYRTQHDLGNQLAGANFADDRGFLPEGDRKEVEQKQIEFDQLEKELTALREEIITKFPEEYKKYLENLQTNLTKILTHLKSLTGEIEFKQSFNKTLCESLLPDLSKHIQNKKIKNSFDWLFDVSASLVEEYRSPLKLS
jgi:hypothetical protein